MGRLIKIQDIDQFSDILKVPDAAISQDILRGVRELDERIELEPAIRQILYDPTETHHGPTEISDILSTKLRLQGEKVVGAIVLKGKSSKKVKSSDIANQYFKLRQLPDLGLIILMAVGHIQDDAQRDFIQTALDIGCHYLIVDAHDCAKLLLAYEKICPDDGMPYGENGICKHGHYQEPGVVLQMEAREDIKYEIPKLQDVSHTGAKRYSAVLLLDRHYPRDVIRKVIVEATEKVRNWTLANMGQACNKGLPSGKLSLLTTRFCANTGGQPHDKDHYTTLDVDGQLPVALAPEALQASTPASAPSQ